MVSATDTQHAALVLREADVGNVARVANVLAEFGAFLETWKAEKLDQAEIYQIRDLIYQPIEQRSIKISVSRIYHRQ